MWAEIRHHLGTDQFRQMSVKPEENVLLGWWQICTYLGIRDRKTLTRWVDEWALPAIKRPDGVWMTTITSIDQWMMLAAQATHEQRTKDGSSTAEKRRARIQSAVERRRAEESASGI
jgi:hypothetical protein